MKTKSMLFAASALASLMAGAPSHAQEIMLGYLQTLGGPFATVSRTNEIAANIAIDEINAAGGVDGKKLKIVTFDTAGKPEQAVVGMRKLAVDDKVLAIIGPFSSGECRVAFPVAEREGVVATSMASSAPKLAEPFTYALRNTTDEGMMFQLLMKTLKDKNLPIKTGAIAYATDDLISKTMGEAVLPKIMKDYGVEVKGSVTFQSQAFDMAAQVSQLKGDAPDLVGLGTNPDTATRFVQEMRRQGVAGRPVGGSTLADMELAKRLGAEGAGMVIPTSFYAGASDKAKAFDAEFVKRAKAAGIDRVGASQFEASTYDIVLMYAYAIKEAKISGDPVKLAAERTAIRDTLRAIKDFPAIEGPISYGKNGDALKTVYVLEINNGAWTLLGSHAPGG